MLSALTGFPQELFTPADPSAEVFRDVIGSLHAAVAHPISDLALAVATAFVGGGLLISVFREELPDAGRSRLGWFALGLLSMTGLLLLATAQHSLGHP